MRILLLGDASSYHTHRWAESLRREGHDVLTLSLEPARGGEALVLPDGWGGKLKYVLSVPRVREVAKGFGPEVVFAHFLPNYGLIGAFLKAKVKVLALWGSDILYWAFKTPFHRSLAGRILKAYDLVVADAGFIVDILRRDFGFPPDRVVVLPFGVGEEVRRLPLKDLPRSPLHFVSLRRHEPLFNHYEILEFLSILSREMPIRITYLQTGNLTPEIRERARGLGLNINFTGSLGYEDYLNVLREAHFCLSVPDRDASSVSLLECMALGGVPIASDIPANREWLDEERGILSPPRAREMYERFKRTFTFPWWERARLSNRSLILQRCNWEENLRRFLSLLEARL